MENVINLDNLNYRDSLIKEYIDQHVGGDFVNATLYVKKEGEQGATYQILYLGVPTGTDISLYEPRYMRLGRVKDRDDNSGNTFHNTLHNIWKVPQNEKVPLINFILDENDSFTYNGFDFYLVVEDNGDTFFDLIREDTEGFPTGYYKVVQEDTGEVDDEGNPITEKVKYELSIGEILSNKIGGFVLLKDNKVCSNFLCVNAIYNDERGEYRISANRATIINIIKNPG